MHQISKTRTTPGRRLLGAMVAVVCLAWLTGCSASSDVAATPSPSQAASFTGTPAEYAALQRACLEEAGFATQEDIGGSSDGFMVSNEGKSQDEIRGALDACAQQIGTPKIQNLSDAELRTRYDARVQQWGCLQAKGLVTGEAISYDKFVDDYERSGQKTLWEPTQNAAAPPAGEGGASDVCPRDSSW